MSNFRRRFVFAGRVQGVGFRMTAHRLATAYPIIGYVRNLSDGRVEIVAEGDNAILSSFFEAIQREFGDMIRDTQEFPDDPSSEPLDGFIIRY